METVMEKVQRALESLEEWAGEEDRSGDPMIYLVMYAMIKLREVLKEAKDDPAHLDKLGGPEDIELRLKETNQ